MNPITNSPNDSTNETLNNTVIVISSEPFDHRNFEICDFYNTVFYQKYIFSLLNWQENMIEDEDILEMLKENDYVKINIKYNNKEYIIYHNFCKDRPVGIITQNGNILEQIGQGVRELNILHGDNNVMQIVNWYHSTTKNCKIYDDDYWYAEI